MCPIQVHCSLRKQHVRVRLTNAFLNSWIQFYQVKLVIKQILCWKTNICGWRLSTRYVSNCRLAPELHANIEACLVSHPTFFFLGVHHHVITGTFLINKSHHLFHKKNLLWKVMLVRYLITRCTAWTTSATPALGSWVLRWGSILENYVPLLNPDRSKTLVKF